MNQILLNAFLFISTISFAAQNTKHVEKNREPNCIQAMNIQSVYYVSNLDEFLKRFSEGESILVVGDLVVSNSKAMFNGFQNIGKLDDDYYFQLSSNEASIDGKKLNTKSPMLTKGGCVSDNRK